MIYTLLTNKALILAYQAHHGQVDYNGIPYVFHPVHLAEQMDDEISCCVALLHDVVEDTDITLDQLAKEFPQEVIKPLNLMAHQKDEDYFEYIRKIKTNPIAVKVKLADLNHNSDQSRCIGSSLSQEQLTYWKTKYAKARAILEEK